MCDWEVLEQEAKKFLPPKKQKKLEESMIKWPKDDSCIARQLPFNGGGSLIWAGRDVTVATLVHEITHAAHHLLDERTVPLSPDTEEVYAYMVEFLFKNLTKQKK